MSNGLNISVSATVDSNVSDWVGGNENNNDKNQGNKNPIPPVNDDDVDVSVGLQ